jgi:lysophospholipase L1-like esterase
MNLLALFALPVIGAVVISPLPNDTTIVYPDPKMPVVTFGQLTDVSKGKTSASTPQPTITVISKKPTRQSKKATQTIALLGDSMIDTLGPATDIINTSLKEVYPKTQFTFLNYGVGATNIEYGLERLTHDYTYLGQQIPALLSKQPDVVVIESFAYNPLSGGIKDLDKQWLTLGTIVTLIKTSLPKTKIVIAATISPNAKVFGDGAPAISFSAQDKIERVNVIQKYLENAIHFAQSFHLPLADVYHESLISGGNGNPQLINSGDHIHYSEEGRRLFAQKVAQAIIENRLLE